MAISSEKEHLCYSEFCLHCKKIAGRELLPAAEHNAVRLSATCVRYFAYPAKILRKFRLIFDDMSEACLKTEVDAEVRKPLRHLDEIKQVVTLSLKLNVKGPMHAKMCIILHIYMTCQT